MNAHRLSPLLVVVVLIISLVSNVRCAYNHGDETNYLANFDQTIASSYAAIDDGGLAPQGLISQCKDPQLLDFSFAVETIVQPDDPSTGIVSASSVQDQCGPTSAADGNPNICVVPSGVQLLMTSSLVVDALVVRGQLYWRDVDQSQVGDQWLCAGFVAIESEGQFIMNVQDAAKTSWIYIMDNGAVHPTGGSRYFGGVASHDDTTSNGPVVKIKGRTLSRTWSLLSAPFVAGQSTLKLLHSPLRMGWQVGDRVGISSTTPSSAGTGQTFTIAALDDSGNITVDGTGDQDHRADFYPPTKLGEIGSSDPYAAALLSAEVVNLSRNIIITGDDYRHVPCDADLPEAVNGEQTSTQGCRCASFRTECTVGLHTAQMHAGSMSIQSARVEKCGQRGIEGKYCLHFHKLRSCPDCQFADNAIEQSHQRGIIVHGTHLSTVSNNVLWDVRGAGIYVEDGNEMYNHIKYNVIVCPWPFMDQTMHGCTIPGSSNSQADTATNQAGIYTETAANDLIGNRVANSFNSMFLQANGQGRGDVYGKVCTNHLAFGRWEGNTFHGALRFGTYTLGGSEPRNTDQSIETNGYNTDREATCSAIDAAGNDRGAPVSILNNVDYGNVFVGHYTAGDIQHRHHKSISNNNLIYWKETKNFADGCGAHISDALYEGPGTMALPDQSTFIIQDTIFEDNVILEANHHCNVGITGFLCMPQYILHNVRWKGSGNGRWTWLQRGGTGGGGIFSLSPPDAEVIMTATSEELSNMQDLLFPPRYVAVASGHFASLLLAGPCDASNSLGSIEASRYDNGILCSVPLRAMKIYTRGLHIDTAPMLRVEAWYDGQGLSSQSITSPDAVQTITLHATGGSTGGLKQGYTFPVVPMSLASYRLSLVALDGTVTNIPSDWLIEFSDPVLGNRWAPEFVQMTINGRDCGSGIISSQHDRRYISGLSVDDSAWGSHGACVGPDQPPDMPSIDCSAISRGKAGAIAATECADICDSPCPANSFCHCGTAKCECKAGFMGSDCSIDLCAAARCGEHGTCASLYLGDSSALPVMSSENACICDEGWHGPLCDNPDPCLLSQRTCNDNGECASDGFIDYCICDPGYSGENCEESCDGLCGGGDGTWPFSCAGYAIGSAVKYKCGPTGGCQYLEPGQEGTPSWCTYMDLSYEQQNTCTCGSATNDCIIVQKCDPDGTCPINDVQVADGTPCNSKPYGFCQGGICIEPPSPAPTSEPSRPPSFSTPSPTDDPTLALIPIYPVRAEASSHQTATNTADKAIDSDLTTRWESEFIDRSWISFYLGESTYELSSIEIAWEPAYAKEYQIQVSDDGSNWSTAFSETDGAGGVEIIKISGSPRGRYIRLLGLKRATVYGYSIWEIWFFGHELTEAPTAAPIVPPSPESCEGRCAGAGPSFGCAWWQMSESHTMSACDPNGGGGCQYLNEGQTTSWCIYERFDAPPTSLPTTDSPSRLPTTSSPTQAPVSPPPTDAPSTARPTNLPISPAPTKTPTAAPIVPPSPESCEGKCAGTGPSFGCAWWQMSESHIMSACDPNGGGGCQYLNEGQTTSWCIYERFDAPPTSLPTSNPTKAPSSSLPSSSPTMSSDKPSVSPSVRSSSSPTAAHSASPTGSPTTSATGNPTASPTKGPTTSPSASPSNSPTAAHSASPTGSPTTSPTGNPTASPTKGPTTSPSASPSNSPTVAHSASPTGTSTASPTKGPTNSPTDSPTDVPTITPNTEPVWETIGFNGFEKEDGSGDCSFNGWLDGGADSRFINNKWNNVHSGNCALRLQDDSSTSTATSETLIVANYDTLKVTFWYKPRRMTASSEEFHLYISKDGGNFALEHTWSSAEFTDGIYQQGIVDNIDVTNASDVRIRFMCNGDSNQDRVFIDDVAMEAM